VTSLIDHVQFVPLLQGPPLCKGAQLLAIVIAGGVTVIEDHR